MDFDKMDLITLVPVSQRAKNRVREHGSTFLLQREEAGNLLVWSLDRGWFGWFEKMKDVRLAWDDNGNPVSQEANKLKVAKKNFFMLNDEHSVPMGKLK